MPRADLRFETARTESLPELVRRELQRAIDEERVQPGDRLPSERELALQFDVSRVVVREALRALEATDAIEIRRNRGAFVRQAPSAVLRTSWTKWLTANRDEVIEVLTIRRAVESLAAAEAARRRRRADVDALTRICTAFEAKLTSPAPAIDALVTLDIEFHRRLAASAGGVLLPRFVDELVGVLRDPPATFATRGRGEITASDHRRILDAVAAKNAEAASAALSDHLTHIIDLVADLARKERRRRRRATVQG